jgi:hypothetical protein
VVLVGAFEDKVSIAVASDESLDATAASRRWRPWSAAVEAARRDWRSPGVAIPTASTPS